MFSGDASHLLDVVVERLEVGIFAVDAEMRVVLWNRFMAIHSGRRSEDIIGKNLFESFPELPEKWLNKKIRNVCVPKCIFQSPKIQKRKQLSCLLFINDM